MKFILFCVLPFLLDDRVDPSDSQLLLPELKQAVSNTGDVVPPPSGTDKPNNPTPIPAPEITEEKSTVVGQQLVPNGSENHEKSVNVPDPAKSTNSSQTSNPPSYVPPPPPSPSVPPLLDYAIKLNAGASQRRIPRPKDAFEIVATPQSVTEQKTYDHDSLPTTGRDDTVENGVTYEVFEPAAAIALPGYDRIGIRRDQQVAVIYEGMAIRYEEDGDFSVRYVIETPATEVTLRMQLLVAEEFADSSGNKAFRTIGRITLPPQRFRPSTKAMVEGGPQQWKVEQKGNSMFLRRSNNIKAIRLQRIATATFGSKPQEP